jgi:protein SCO1/2
MKSFRALTVAAFALMPMVASPAISAEPSINRYGANYFPNVPVVTQDGKTLNFYDDVIKGKRVVVSFIYTSCPDICPLTTARLTQVEDQFRDEMGRDLFFVSMTVDPEHDTPEKLKEFSKAFGTGPGWLFLTGKPEDIRFINSRLGDKSKVLNEHRNEITLGNDATGEWARNTVFGDLDRLVLDIRSMNPEWRLCARLAARPGLVQEDLRSMPHDRGWRSRRTGPAGRHRSAFDRVADPVHPVSRQGAGRKRPYGDGNGVAVCRPEDA